MFRGISLALALVACGGAPPPTTTPTPPPSAPCPVCPAPPPAPAAVDAATIKAKSLAFYDAFDRDDSAAFLAATTPSMVMMIVDMFRDRATVARGMEKRAGEHAPARTRQWKGEPHVIVDANAAVFIAEALEHDNGQDFDDWNTLVWVRDGDTWKVANVQTQEGEVEHERAKWDSVYRGEIPIPFKKAPNQLLVDAVAKRKPGKAIDLMTGQGRNALYLAQHGWTVTGVDVSNVGRTLAREAAKKQKLKVDFVDADADLYDLGTDKWDLITMIYAGDNPQLVEHAQRALKKGGLFVLEFFHADSAASKQFGSGGWKTGQLAALFGSGYKILRDDVVDDVADWGESKDKIVRFVAEKQ